MSSPHAKGFSLFLSFLFFASLLFYPQTTKASNISRTSNLSTSIESNAAKSIELNFNNVNVAFEGEIPNQVAKEKVRELAAFAGADTVQVLTADLKAALIEQMTISFQDVTPELIEEDPTFFQKNLIRLANGSLYYQTHPGDTQRSRPQTYTALSNIEGVGKDPNPITIDAAMEMVDSKIKGAQEGKSLYLIPVIMGPRGSAASEVFFQLTPNPIVALLVSEMSGFGDFVWDVVNQKEAGDFYLGLHESGDLDEIHEKKAAGVDERFFISIPEEGLVFSYGGNYGGNAILPKKFGALRLNHFKGVHNGFRAEHMYQLEKIENGQSTYIYGAYPSYSGKTTTAFATSTIPGIEFHPGGDDIVKFYNKDGEPAGFNVEYAAFGVIKGVGPSENPQFYEAVLNEKGLNPRPNIQINQAVNIKTGDTWWPGKSPLPTVETDPDYEYWYNWQGRKIADLEREGKVYDPNKEHGKDGFVWNHANSRVVVPLENFESISETASLDNKEGVSVDMIFYGGRVWDAGFEPKVRMFGPNAAWGAYDAFQMVVQTTAAEEGGIKTIHDPRANSPFITTGWFDDFEHQMRFWQQFGEKSAWFGHKNYFNPNGAPGLLGFDEVTRLFKWADDLRKGKTNQYQKTAIGIRPTPEAIILEDSARGIEPLKDLNGVVATKRTLARDFYYDAEYWLETVLPNQMDYLKEIEKQEDRRAPEEFYLIHQAQEKILTFEVTAKKLIKARNWDGVIEHFGFSKDSSLNPLAYRKAVFEVGLERDKITIKQELKSVFQEDLDWEVLFGEGIIESPDLNVTAVEAFLSSLEKSTEKYQALQLLKDYQMAETLAIDKLYHEIAFEQIDAFYEELEAINAGKFNNSAGLTLLSA